VTSPLRRYLDLVAHQQIRAYRTGRPLLAPEAVLERIGAAEAVLASARRAEQMANRHWTLVWLQRNPGWRGTGVLVAKRGLSGRLLLPDLALETQLHLPADLPLDSQIPLRPTGVDLPHLDAHFRIDGEVT
jgi:exoribonuclease II